MGNKFKLTKIINKKKVEVDVKKELENYDLETSEQLRRKMDFYYHPYKVDISAKKWMNFSNGSKFNY